VDPAGKKKTDIEKDNPPVFRSWRRWYALVLGALVAQIILYFWLTSSFQ
jgi:hypothetical protein